MKKHLFLLCVLLSATCTIKATKYYVNNTSTTGDIYCTAIGSGANNGLSPATPKLTLASILTTYSASFLFGDTIFIDAGNYTEIQLSSPINGVVIKGAGVLSTTITKSGSDRYFMLINDNNTVISDLKITGYDNQTISGVQALGIANNITGVKIINVQVDGSSTTSTGGGYPIEVGSGVSALFSGGGATCNTWDAGGGMHIAGTTSTITIQNYQFVGNYQLFGNGTALKISGGIVNIYNTRFESNTIGGDKSGMGIDMTTGTVNVYDSYFYKNETNILSNNIGGAVSIHGGSFRITRSVFLNNIPESATSGIYGAGIGVTSGTVFIDSCKFSGNVGARANDVYVSGGTVLSRNCIYGSAANQVGHAGGTFSISSCGTPTKYGTVTSVDAIAPTYTAAPTLPDYLPITCVVIPCTTPTISSSAPTSTLCSGSTFTTNFSATTTSSQTSYSWTSSAVPGITGHSLSGTGNINETLTNTGASTLTVTYSITPLFNLSCNGPVVVYTASVFPTTSVSAASSTICSGNTATITPAGSSSYTLQPGALTGTSFTLSPGSTSNYTITGVPLNGCPVLSSTVSITVNTTPTAAITPPSSLTCTSQTITLTGSGGGSYSWSGPGIVTGSATATPSVNVAGIYNLTVTSSGCSNSTSVTVVSNTITPLVSTTTNTLTCSAASINISATTTTTPVSYTWSGPGIISATNISTITVNQSGTFNYTVTNSTNNCATTGTVTVLQNTTPPSATATGGTLTCVTSSVNLTGGPISGVTYSWTGTGLTGPTNSATAIATATGAYTLITTGTNGCTNTAVAVVSENITNPQISIGSSQTVTCASPSVTLNGSSITSGVNYNWTGPTSGTPAGTTPTSSISVVSASGIYTLTVTDPVNGCSSFASQSVSTNTTLPDISLGSITQTITCAAPSVTLSGSSLTSGITYSWNPGGSTPTNSTTTVNTNGTYTLSVINPLSGCISTSVVTVTSNTVLPTLTLTPTSYTTTCSAPTTTLIAESSSDPDVSYTWTIPSGGSLNNPNISNPVASGSGVFTVQATNTVSGCMSSIATTTIIADANTPVLNTTITNSTICSGGTSTLSISGADTYTWSTSETTTSITVSPTITTTYSVTGTNTLTGCFNVTNVTVHVNITPTVSVLSISNLTVCSGNTTTITASGANTYTLTDATNTYTNNPFTINPQTTTTYTLSGESIDGCLSTNTETVTITVNTTPTVAILSVSNPTICSGNSSVITPSGALSYTLEPGTLTGTSFTVSPGSTITYTLSGISPKGCLSANTETTIVMVNATPTISIASVSNNSVCSNNSSVITPTGAITYTLLPDNISGTSFTVNPITTTTYTLEGISAEGCLSNNTVTTSIVVYTTPTITILSVNNPSICIGNSSIITPTGAVTYTLLPDNLTGTSFTMSPTATGIYTLSGTSADGCLSANSVTTSIIVNALPTVTATANPNTTCTTGTVTLMANTTATSYTWTTGNGITTGNQNQSTINFPASGLSTGTYTYTVQVTDGNNCVSVASTATLNVIDVPNAAFDLSDLTICQNQNGTLSINTPQTGVTYDWNINGQTITNTNPLTVPTNITGTAGTYTVSTIASIGTCSNTAANTLTVNALPTISLITPTASGCENASAQLDVANPNGSYVYNWSYNGQPVSTGASLNVSPLSQDNAGTYTVTAIDGNGCVNSTTGLIDARICAVYIPEIFTPNGDGKNDGFEIKNIENYPNNKLKIFNRWGNLIYTKDAYQNEFDGFANTGDQVGKSKLPAGTYYVILEFGDGTTETYNGYLLLQY